MMNLNNPVLLGVYIASITAIVSVITNLATAIVSNSFQDKREKEKWLKTELQAIYGGSIKSLATLLTLSGVESNLDAIEESIVESKKWLALTLIFSKRKRTRSFRDFEEEILLFTSGQYSKLLELFASKEVKPSEKYQSINNDVYRAADIMLTRILKFASQDERLH